MEIKNQRISNLTREELSELWKHLSTEEYSDLILRSNEKEIGLLIGHLSEQALSQTFGRLNGPSISKVFEKLNQRQLNKVISLLGARQLTKIVNNLDKRLIVKLLKYSSKDQQKRVLSLIAPDQKDMLVELSDEESELDNYYNYYLSEKFENSLEKEALGRIKELEERERFLERRQRAREEQYSAQLEHLRNQVADAEKEIHMRQIKYKNIEKNLVKKEGELRESIRNLQEDHQRQVQEKIEIKVPEYVKSALKVLEVKEKEFVEKAHAWNRNGTLALAMSIISAILAIIYGAFEFNSAAKNNIDWFFFSFLLLKGLIVVTLFGAFAKHAYTIGNAYMHESLKRSDRMHAINFGKLYLEVYGNDVSQSDMKAIFENWNLDSDSAFTKIKQTNFEPKVVDQVTQMLKAVSDVSKETKSPIKERP